VANRNSQVHWLYDDDDDDDHRDADDDGDGDADDDIWFQLDVNGECETKYVINSEPSVDYSSVSNMVVTKVKDLNKCITRNSFEQGLFAGLPHHPSEKVRRSIVYSCLLSGFLSTIYWLMSVADSGGSGIFSFGGQWGHGFGLGGIQSEQLHVSY